MCLGTTAPDRHAPRMRPTAAGQTDTETADHWHTVTCTRHDWHADGPRAVCVAAAQRHVGPGTGVHDLVLVDIEAAIPAPLDACANLPAPTVALQPWMLPAAQETPRD